MDLTKTAICQSCDSNEYSKSHIPAVPRSHAKLKAEHDASGTTHDADCECQYQVGADSSISMSRVQVTGTTKVIAAPNKYAND